MNGIFKKSIKDVLKQRKSMLKLVGAVTKILTS